LQPAEISGQRQAGLAAEPVLPAGFLEFGHKAGDPCVLPNQGVRQRLPGLAVPYNSGFPLVGNSYSSKISRMKRSFLHRLTDHLLGTAPDFFRVMLHPARPGVNLFMLFLGHGYNAPGAVKHDETGTSCSLINCADIACQFISPNPDAALCLPVLTSCRRGADADGHEQTWF